MLFIKKHHHISQTTILGASPPLILGFHPSKRHAALIALRSGQHCSCFYLGITRTEAFFMASNASYPDIRSMIFSGFTVLLLLIIYEYHVVSVLPRFNLMLVLVAQNQSHRDNTLLLLCLVDLIYYGLLLSLRVCVISARLGLANGLDDPVE